MDQPTKLQEQELQELQDFQKKSDDLIVYLGQLSFKKLKIEEEEEYLKSQYQQLLLLEKQISDKFKEKYGIINVDLKSGDIIYPL